jgi:tetratricopeptide (TPR) repeat protein/predicted Ser/Thr protein kinase
VVCPRFGAAGKIRGQVDSDPRLPELFGEASELEGEALAAWLAALREEDSDLAREVEELLAASRAGKKQFESPAWDRLPADTGDAAPIPDRIGVYRVLREIGRGGMGRVFLAEQEGEEFRRQVALKVIDRPGAGPDTVRRFRDEVRILAALEHAGIARFFDGGRAPDGTWFLALEYVEGEDLLAFVRGRGLDLRARVELFLQVLDAVDFAHRRLVVHRDLKPSNVLVDAEGRTKLLDFGISKVVDPSSGEDATLTQARAFTPDYASPEQLRGAAATVATDVYSLGVMLYELLAGRRPFRRKEPDLDLASVGRDPEPPSTVVRDTAPPSEAAAGEAVPPIAWRDLAGDLDAITLKALRAEPEKRYPSVEALAADLRRWLTGKPVEARRGGRRYRVGKFVRRHRVPVAFAAAAALALVAGAVGIVVQSRRAARAATVAEEQRDFALNELSRAEAINDLNAFLLSDAAAGGKPFTTDDLLARAERILERQRGGRNEHRADILFAIGRQYRAQDEQGKARKLLTRAYDLTRGSPDRATRARVACALADVVADEGDFERADRLLREGLELPDERQFALPKVFCQLRASQVARNAGDGEKAVAHALAAQNRMRESGQASDLLELTVAMDVAESYRLADRRREADAAFEKAWEQLEATGRGETEKAGTLLNNWALVVRSLGRPIAAEELFRRAIDVTSSGGPEQGVSPMLLNNYGRTLLELGRARDALGYSERADREARVSGSQIVITQALFLRALLHLTLGETDRAAAVLAELEPRVSRLPESHPGRPVLLSLKGLLAEARGDAAAAATFHDRAVSQSESHGHDTQGFLLLRRSAFHLHAGRPEDARSDAARSLAFEQKATGPGSLSNRIGLAHLALARALAAAGHPDEARDAATAARKHLEPSVGPDHPDTRAARELALP